MVLRGWKALAREANVHVQTVRVWHYYRLPIPFFKSAPGKAGKISILKEVFHMYLLDLNKHFQRSHPHHFQK